MVEVATSGNTSNSDCEIDVNTRAADVSMSEDLEWQEMQPLQVKPVPSEHAEETQDAGEEVQVQQFKEKVFSVVDVTLLVHQIYVVQHPFGTINAELTERLEPFISTHRFNHICGLVVVKPRPPVWNNCKNVTHLFDGTTHHHRVLSPDAQVLLVDGRYCSTAMKEITELEWSYP